MSRALAVAVFVAAAWQGDAAQARLWTDSAGKYHVEASLVEFGDGQVRLLRADNQKIVTVPLERLSQDDQQFVRGLQGRIRAGREVFVQVSANVVAMATDVRRVAREVRLQPAEAVRLQPAEAEPIRPAVYEVRTAPPAAATVAGPVKIDHIDEDDFERQVLKSDVPVLVDFCAEWCGPCRSLFPILDELAQEGGQGKIVKIDIDRNPNLAARYGVQSIPNLIVFKHGEVQDRQVGVTGKERLKSMLSM